MKKEILNGSINEERIMKRYLLPVIIIMFSATLSACGEKSDALAEETVKTLESVVDEPSAAPVKEDVKKDEPEQPVSEAEPEQERDEPDTEYARLYTDLIRDLYSTDKADRFILVNVDGNDIPELVAVNSKDQLETGEDGFLYTVYDHETVLLESSYGSYLKVSFSEGHNVIYTCGGDVGFYVAFSSIEQGKTAQFLSADDMPEYDDSTGTDIHHYAIEEIEATEEEYRDKLTVAFSDYNPFTRIDPDGLHTITYDFNDLYFGKDTGTRPYMSYIDIMKVLGDLTGESEEAETEESWKAVYLDYLYDVIDGNKPLYAPHESFKYGESTRSYFSLKDITDDGIPELWISGDGSPYWNIVFIDNGDKAVILNGGESFVYFYDPDDKKIYANDSGDFEHYTLYSTENGQITRQYTLSEGDADVIKYYKDNEEISKDEMADHDIQYEKAYNKYFVDMNKYELNKKNIEDKLGK